MANLRQKATVRESAHHVPFVSMKAKSNVQLVSRYRRSVGPWFRLNPSFINEMMPELGDQFTDQCTLTFGRLTLAFCAVG